MSDNRPIGVFDSGVGGLTVVEKIMDFFPNEDILYIADTKNNPYGEKTPEQIEEIVINVATELETLGVKIIIIACNTATVFSKVLNERLSIRFIGVVNPTAKSAYQASERNHILILATSATIRSRIYQNYLESRNARYIALAAPQFVEIIEDGDLHSQSTKQTVQRILLPYKNSGIDTVLLGCTHFSLFEPHIQECFPHARLIDGGEAVSEVLMEKLDQMNMRADFQKKGRLNILVTGDVDKFKNGIRWFHKPISSLKGHWIKK